MSHSLTLLAGSQAFPGTLTIINYVVGGESVTLAELAGLALSGCIFGTVPPGSNSLGVPLFPLLSGGKILLFRFTAGAPVEIAATTALNAVIPFLAFVVRDPSASSIYP
jgi:hypothetical protein